MTTFRPHLLGIDDAPFEKGQREPVPIVGVLMEGADLVESIAVSRFAVDGDDATGFLASWLPTLRGTEAAQGVVLGGITIAGLGVVDVAALAAHTGLPVLVVTRRRPSDERLCQALRAAGLAARIPIVERSPRAVRIEDGLHLAHAGVGAADAARLVHTSLRKASLPEPLRIAHLIGAAWIKGESRGRS